VGADAGMPAQHVQRRHEAREPTCRRLKAARTLRGETALGIHDTGRLRDRVRVADHEESHRGPF
jgi:hypothetical protein